MRMRFRNDGWHYADLKSHGWRFAEHLGEQGDYVYGSWCKTQEELDQDKKWWDEVPPAQPGDVWRVRWYKQEGEGPIAGYAICCIGCGKVHSWTTANNCSQKYETSYTDKDGEHKYFTCPHSGTGSCWEWSGSAEEGTLTASPSLQVVAHKPGDCNWHGYITNGLLYT